MAMKLVRKTAEYKIFLRGDNRYAVQNANGKPVNGEEKVNILIAEELIKVTAPTEAAPDVDETVEEVAAEATEEVSPTEEPAEEEAPAEEPAAEEAPAEEPAEEEAPAEEPAEEEAPAEEPAEEAPAEEPAEEEAPAEEPAEEEAPAEEPADDEEAK